MVCNLEIMPILVTMELTFGLGVGGRERKKQSANCGKETLKEMSQRLKRDTGPPIFHKNYTQNIGKLAEEEKRFGYCQPSKTAAPTLCIQPSSDH